MDLSSGATAAKDEAKDTKEQAVQAFVSSGLTRQAEDASEPIRAALSSRTRRVEASEPAKPLLTRPPHWQQVFAWILTTWTRRRSN